MIIVSQDRKMIVNFENVQYVDIDECRLFATTRK